MQQHLRQMARNNAWANETLFGAVCALPDTALRTQRPSFFGTLPRLLNHIYEIDLYYLDAAQQGGRGRSVFERTDVADMVELAGLQAVQDRALIDFCDGLTAQMLATHVPTERPDGMTSEALGRLLLHVFQHQVHHRGQAHGMLSQAGVNPPQLDDFFLEYGRVPSAERYWEEMHDA